MFEVQGNFPWYVKEKKVAFASIFGGGGELGEKRKKRIE